ncbi:MAG TPA: DNA mismatch repair protein MutS [Candidatus Nanoarchaeia archaeon]|nr:DNA mismatch repair protein MutS [Candidatus Nanoarchaeia archaeon]
MSLPARSLPARSLPATSSPARPSLTGSSNEGILQINPSELTPGMRQYQEAKRANPDCLVMLRMGDFYEMFYEDALTASRELEIVLTSRGKGGKKAPLAGVPYHALETYLGRLIKKGYKVAIIEQLEDPKLAQGLVKRGLVRIVTPGTVMDSSMLSEKENNYLAAINCWGDNYALACCDISTGEFWTSLYPSQQELANELQRISPPECIVPESLRVNTELTEKIKSLGCFLNTLDDNYFSDDTAKKTILSHFSLSSLETFGLAERKQQVAVTGGLLHYLVSTQKNNLPQVTKILLKSNEQAMLLDSSTVRNLELIRNIKDGTSRGTLLSILDQTATAMGARLIKKWLQAPLLQEERINLRLQAVSELVKEVIAREEIISLLNSVYDLERLISRINYGNSNPRDLLALRNSLQNLPLIKQKLESFSSSLLSQIRTINTLEDFASLIELAIREDAPLTVREGGIIKPSFNEELMELSQITKNSKKYLAELEEKEKEKTGIASLKISYNRVFGYFIEVTKKNIHLVPATYIRKQTTANSERYITEELKLEEEKIMGAQEKSIELEYRLFKEIATTVASRTKEIQALAAKLAALDVLCCFAKISAENNYCCPQLVKQDLIQVKNGRHPVIEKMEPKFIANDLLLKTGEMMIITGPNMAGKSTIMRQTALIVLMAQIGCFVPADECLLGVVDKIFTRVGAYDDLSRGQSTFMVEMLETAAIVNNATENSLVILDEIGRGTSTFDGVSIAWSVAEHIHHKIKAKALFATHYHVLNKLADRSEKIKNYNVAVKEVQGQLLFLRKLIAGGTDQSYGIHVAKFAGLPAEVIERAQQIQSLLEKEDQMIYKVKTQRLEKQRSLDGF